MQNYAKILEMAQNYSKLREIMRKNAKQKKFESRKVHVPYDFDDANSFLDGVEACLIFLWFKDINTNNTDTTLVLFTFAPNESIKYESTLFLLFSCI